MFNPSHFWLCRHRSRCFPGKQKLMSVKAGSVCRLIIEPSPACDNMCLKLSTLCSFPCLEHCGLSSQRASCCLPAGYKYPPHLHPRSYNNVLTGRANWQPTGGQCEHSTKELHDREATPIRFGLRDAQLQLFLQSRCDHVGDTPHSLDQNM